MAYHFEQHTNNYGLGALSNPIPDQMWYNFITFMTSHGFTVSQSSDGTSFSQSSNILTGSGTGAGGLANSATWFVLKEPSGGAGSLRREWGFFRVPDASTIAYSQNRVIAYAPDGFYTTATNNGHGSAGTTSTVNVSAANPPISLHMTWNCYNQPTDCWSLTTASINQAGTQFVTQTAGIPWHYMFFCNDASPYQWYILIYTVSTVGAPIVAGFYAYDTVLNGASGEADPTAIWCIVNSGTIDGFNSNVSGPGAGGSPTYSTQGTIKSWFNYAAASSKADLSSQISANTQRYLSYNNATSYFSPSLLGTVPKTYTGNNLSMSSMLVSALTPATAPFTCKGQPNLFSSVITSASNMRCFTQSTLRDKLVLTKSNQGITIPWDGTIPLI